MMKKYSMTCTCGDVMSVEAMDQTEAVSKMKAMMTPEAVAAHFAEKHMGEAVPSQDQMMAMIEANLVEAM